MLRKMVYVLFGSMLALPTFASTAYNTACIESVAYYEANTEGFEAMLAVASVVMNRAGNDYNKVCKVVKSPSQFSWVGKKTIKRFENTRHVAQLVQSGFLHPKFKKATHFHDTSIKPEWAKKMVYVGRIKRIKFYAENE